MGKIRLTESQIEMLQNLEEQLPSRKIVKITAEQYTRIFESNSVLPVKPNRLSSKVSKNFKRYGKEMPGEGIKFEGEAINQAGPTDIMDFGQQIIRFLKGLLTDPTDEHMTSFWRKLDVSKDELQKRMFDLGMIGHSIINGKKIIKILKNNFHENIKTLYKELVPQNEGMVQLGNDIELDEMNNDDIKKSMTNQLKRKDGPKPSIEQMKAKIAQRRAEELKRREAEKNRPLGEDNYPAGAAHDPSAPWNQVDPPEGRRAKERPFDLLWWHQETAIFEKDGKYYSFNVESVDNDEYSEYADREEIPLGRDEDGMMDVEYGDWEMDENIIDNYVNDNYKHLSYGKGFDDYEDGLQMVEMDQEMVDDMLATAKYVKNPKDQQRMIAVLSNLTVSETTTAASSGAFVAPMTMNAPITGVSPADEMKRVVGEDDIEEVSKKKKRAKAQQMSQQKQADSNKPAEKKGGLQMTQFTDQEIWDAMRGNVHKDKKKDSTKYAGRKDKHKGRGLNEIEDDNDVAQEALDGLKYKNFQHPALGYFSIGNIHNKDEDDKTLTYSIDLNGDNGKTNSELLYIFDKRTGDDKLIFNHASEMIKDAYKVFDELYKLVFDGVKEALRPNEDIQEQGIGGGAAGGGATYDTPGFPASDFFGNKGKKGKAPVNKGITHTKTMYPKGKMVKESTDNQTKTAYPEGGFVELDDCTKLNNNKEAQNGGCSVGAVDNVVKTKQTKGSVVSDDAVYYEVAKKTGRTIAEVKKIIQSRKG